MLDTTIKTTQNYVDDYGMFLGQNRPYEPEADHGMGDCIGSNLAAYLAYDYAPFVSKIRSCFEFKMDKKESYLQGYRHPSLIGKLDYNDFSRDHLINALIAFKASGDDYNLKIFARRIRWRISDKYTLTPDLWLLMKGLDGDMLAMDAFYVLDIVTTFINTYWNIFIKTIGGFGPELGQYNYIPNREDKATKWQKFLRKLVYPRYTLYQKALLYYALPRTWEKNLIRKIALKDVDKRNLLLRILFGDKTVTVNEVNNYVAMNSWRWDVCLNNLNDRDIWVITDPELLKANVLDVDLLKKMFSKIREI